MIWLNKLDFLSRPVALEDQRPYQHRRRSLRHRQHHQLLAHLVPAPRQRSAGTAPDIARKNVEGTSGEHIGTHNNGNKSGGRSVGSNYYYHFNIVNTTNISNYLSQIVLIV